MPQQKKVDVNPSKPHRRKGHWVPGYFMRISKAFRIRRHKRQQRRTQAKLTEKGTRKQERKEKKPQPSKPQPAQQSQPQQKKGGRNWLHPFKARKEHQKEITDFT